MIIRVLAVIWNIFAHKLQKLVHTHCQKFFFIVFFTLHPAGSPHLRCRNLTSQTFHRVNCIKT